MNGSKRQQKWFGGAFGALVMTIVVAIVAFGGLRGVVAEAADPVRSFVERMYTVALGREAETEGLAYWTEKLTNKEANGAIVANEFFNSDEFRELSLSNEDFLNRLYQTFFDRQGDTEGKGFWMNCLTNNTATRQEVLVSFVNSAEFLNICDTYGIRRGKLRIQADDSLTKTEQFTQRFYSCILERTAEADGLSFWAGVLDQKKVTPEEAAKSFFLGDEYVLRFTSNEDFVSAMYFTFMDRDPDESGLNFWVNSLSSGLRREAAIDEFCKAAEFTLVKVRYGFVEPDLNEDGYHDLDVAAVNSIIANNGLQAAKDDIANWSFVVWSDGAVKRVSELKLKKQSLTGKLNVSDLTELRALDCEDNGLIGLNVSGLNKLENLNIAKNSLTRLEVKNLGKLTELLCYKNKLKTLNLSGLAKLSFLSCHSNELSSLSLSSLTGLEYLYCNRNQLSELNVLSLTKLTTLSCHMNLLTELDVTGLTLLTTLNKDDSVVVTGFTQDN